MFVKVTCPTCGHQETVPDSQMGRRVQCSNCTSPFVPGPANAAASQQEPAFSGPGNRPAPPAPPAPAPPQSRTILAPLEEPIRYNCPRCAKSLESPRSTAGQKLNCPGCGQRLQIPQPPAPAAPPLNKTVLAVESQAAITPLQPVPPAAPTPSSAPGAADVPFVELADEQPARRERCLECGRDISGLEKLLTCPNCGSLFCSSACYRDHQDFAHAKKKRRRRERREGFRCPYCGTTEPPYVTNTISSEGWVVFALLLIFCFPLFWIGLLITEDRRTCADCGARLS